MNPEYLVSRVTSVLTDDLRSDKWKGHHNHLAGHCQTAVEACWFLLGADQWQIEIVPHEDTEHWYLRNSMTGAILDPTVGQFFMPPCYEDGKPLFNNGAYIISAEAQEIIRRLVDDTWQTTVEDSHLST